MIKDGVCLETYSFQPADTAKNNHDYINYLAVGRQPPENETIQNFMLMEHPSLSRKHAIFVRNKRTSEVFLYDHGSTHGTKLNYKPVKAFQFHEISDGDILSFGESSRMIIAHIEDEQ